MIQLCIYLVSQSVSFVYTIYKLYPGKANSVCHFEEKKKNPIKIQTPIQFILSSPSNAFPPHIDPIS